MQTLVLFDAGKNLFSIMLENLALIPARGNFYILNNSRYEIAEITEYLGHSDTVSGQDSGNAVLLEVLQVMSADTGEDQTLRLSAIQPLGKLAGKLYSTTPGGVITAKPLSLPEFDTVLYVKLNALKKARRQAAMLSGNSKLDSSLQLGIKSRDAGTTPALDKTKERKARQDNK